NTEMRLTLQEPLPAGGYRVEWRILAADGHVTEGTIAFTVEGTAAQAEAPAEPEATAPEGQEPEAPSEEQPTAPETQETTEPVEAPAAAREARGAPMLPLLGAVIAVAGAAILVVRRWRS
ncbi:MAG TPA: copper resistance protein CopC, partial [Bacillota bacterium]